MMEKITLVNASDAPASFRQLLEEYSRKECLERHGFSLDFQNFAYELETLPGRYVPPAGGAWLICLDGQPAGCCAFRPFSDLCCEIKRLYIRDSFRGDGLGKTLLRHILSEARSAGYTRACCDTLPAMQAAIRLYASVGFFPTEPYHHNLLPGAVCLAINL